MVRAPTNNDPLINVYVHKLDKPMPQNLDLPSWHKVLFSAAKTANIKILADRSGEPKEKVYNFHGELRYRIEYQTLEGIQLKTAMLVLSANGEYYALVYEMPDPVFSQNVHRVETLFDNVAPARSNAPVP